MKANADFRYQKAVIEHQEFAGSNSISRLWHKKWMQRQYEEAYRAAVKTGKNTVHFMNQVDGADLMVLIDDGKKEPPAVCSCSENVLKVMSMSSVRFEGQYGKCLGKGPMVELESKPEPKENGGTPLLIVLILVALGGGGAFAYIKYFKPKQGVKFSSDLDDYDFEDEEYENEDI